MGAEPVEIELFKPRPLDRAFALEDRYQDPRLPGSLVGALRAWQDLVAAGTQHAPHRLSFTFYCSSESRADRVAAFLHRRLLCSATAVSSIEGEPRELWRVTGFTRSEVLSLSGLERDFSWLLGTAFSHQVRLIELGAR